MFVAHDHNNYAQYVPLQLITLINLSDTHSRCNELLEQNEFSVSQSLVLCLRNAFDITIRQTIKMYYRLQQLLEAVSILANTFSSSFKDNELYVLAFGVPAKPGIAKDLIEADEIGKNVVADFIGSH